VADVDQADVGSLNAVVHDGEEGGIEVVDTIRSGGRSPEDAALADERSVVIREALEQLNDRERLIIRMVFVEGRSAREASRVLGVSESRVSQVTREIRAKLAGHIERYDAHAA
jgi:RNA polymerase sigma factor for flagellar operon FliA